jgi:hypothetical protein
MAEVQDQTKLAEQAEKDQKKSQPLDRKANWADLDDEGEDDAEADIGVQGENKDQKKKYDNKKQGNRKTMKAAGQAVTGQEEKKTFLP